MWSRCKSLAEAKCSGGVQNIEEEGNFIDASLPRGQVLESKRLCGCVHTGDFSEGQNLILHFIFFFLLFLLSSFTLMFSFYVFPNVFLVSLFFY